MKLFDLFKSKAEPSGFVTFDDKIRWMLCYPDKCKRTGINCHFDVGSTSWHNDLFFDQYLFCYTIRSSHWSDENKYKYFKNNAIEYKCYLVDESFVPDKDFSQYNTSFCYPLIIQHNYDEFWYKEGPWLIRLKELMNDCGVGESFIQNKQWVNEQELLHRIEQQNKQHCCEMKKRRILENFK